MPANPPSRSTQNLTLSFSGLFVVPCALYSGAEESSVHRKQFVRDENGDLHPVGKKDYDKITGNDVSSSDIVKMVEVMDDSGEVSLVEITDEEIEAAVGGVNTGLSIVGFLPLDRLTDGTYSTEKPYQLRPRGQKKGKATFPDPAADKAYSLLVEVMKRKNVFALVNFTARSRPRYAAFTPDGTLHTLRFDEEVRAPRPMPLAEISEAELQMGEMLVASNMVDEPPVLIDTANNAVISYAGEKAKAQRDGKEFEGPKKAAEPEVQNDMLAALTAAVQAKQASKK